MKRVPSTKGVAWNEKLYFFATDINMLWCMDKKTRYVEMIGAVPTENLFSRYLFGNIVVTHGIIYLIPYLAKNVWKYVIKEKRWECICLPIFIQKTDNKFFGAVVYDDYIFLLGYMVPGVAVIDTRSDAIEFINAPESCLRNIKKYGFLNWSYFVKDDFILAPVMCNNMVLKIDLATRSIQPLTIGNETNSYAAIVYDGKYYWLAPRVGVKTVRWDGNGNIEEYSLPECYSENEMCFGDAFCIDDNIFFSSYTGKTYVFNKTDFHNGKMLNMNIQFVLEFDNHILIQDNYGKFELIDSDENFEYTILDNEWQKYIIQNNVLESDKVMMEREEVNLTDLIHLLKEGC